MARKEGARIWGTGQLRNTARESYNTGRMKVRDVIKRLEEDGWYLARTKGSHRQFHHPAKPGTVTVAGHPSVDIPPGTMNNILKQAGLK